MKKVTTIILVVGLLLSVLAGCTNTQMENLDSAMETPAPTETPDSAMETPAPTETPISAMEIPISAGYKHTVGMREDGTVVAMGDNMYEQCDVQDWQDIVSVSAGGFHTVGLRKDGIVVAKGLKIYGQCEVQDWENIKIP